jgi:hypothetical protein
MAYSSPGQCVGYLACVLGVVGFLQKDYRRLKWFIAVANSSTLLRLALVTRPNLDSVREG